MSGINGGSAVKLRFDLDGDDGADLVSKKFLNGIKRNVSLRLVNVYPEDFGATGDGVTDDTSTMQLALNNRAGAILHLTEGKTYKVNTLNIPAGTIIWSFGATLDFSASHQKGLIFADGGGFVGGELVGAGNSSYTIGSIAIYASGTNNHPLAPTFIDGPVVRYAVVRDWGEYGVRARYTNYTTTKYTKFKNIGYAACGGTSCNNSNFLHNEVDGVTPGSSGGDAYGCFFDREDGLSETSDPRSYNCKMNFNNVKNVTATLGANGHALDSHGGVDIEFIGNKVELCQAGIFSTSSTIAGTQLLAPIRHVIAGNEIDITNTGYAILVRGAMTGSTVNEYATDCTLSANTITGGGVAGDNITGAIQLQATKGLSANLGAMRACSPFAVCLYSDNIDFNIFGGTLSDPFDNSVTVAACIGVRGNNNKGLIGGQTYAYTGAALGTYVAVNSVYISGGLTGLDLEFGKSAFRGIDATHLAFNDGTGTGVNPDGIYAARGSKAISLASGAANKVQSVTFQKRFPSIPKITLTNAGAIAPGGKTVALRTSNVTTTGFDIIVYPYDLGTFSASGTLDVDWHART